MSKNLIYLRYQRNKFKSENFMKLSFSIRHIIKIVKSLKIITSGLKIEAKEKNYTNMKIKSIIPFLQTFYIYK